jgi:hypothetical protein
VNAGDLFRAIEGLDGDAVAARAISIMLNVRSTFVSISRPFA